METRPPNPPDMPRMPITAEVLEWAKQTFDEDAFWVDMREIETTGGVAIEKIVADIEAIVRLR